MKLLVISVSWGEQQRQKMRESCREREVGIALPVLPGQKKTLPRALPEQSEGQHQSLLMSILSQAPQQELWGSPHHGPCSEMRINYPAVPRECQRINQNTSGVEPGLRLWGHSGNYRCMGLVTAESCWVSEV